MTIKTGIAENASNAVVLHCVYHPYAVDLNYYFIRLRSRFHSSGVKVCSDRVLDSPLEAFG